MEINATIKTTHPLRDRAENSKSTFSQKCHVGTRGKISRPVQVNTPRPHPRQEPVKVYSLVLTNFWSVNHFVSLDSLVSFWGPEHTPHERQIYYDIHIFRPISF